MSKKILFRLAILLTVGALAYGMFWFFKVGQIEKQISNFISSNGSNVLISDVSVSGFPLKQRVVVSDLKFTIPNQLLNKKQVIIKNAVLVAKIFSSEFTVTFSEAPTLQDVDGNVYNVEFSKDPEIKVSFANGKITKLTYVDSGYRIVNSDKNTVYAASSSVLNFQLTEESDGKIAAKITSDIRDIEGFGVMEVYKNAFEKGLMERIKTGEVVVGNNTVTTSPAADNATPANNQSTADNATLPVASVDPAATTLPAEASVANTSAIVAESVTAVPDSSLIKSSLIFDIEYTLTPAQGGEKKTDPAGLPQIPVANDGNYNRVTKINSLEFYNPLYRVTINGEINNFFDDEMPSGSMTVKIENIASLVDYVKLSIKQMIEKPDAVKLPTSASTQSDANVVTTDINAAQPTATVDPTQQVAANSSSTTSATPVATSAESSPTVATNVMSTNHIAVDEAYAKFLDRVSNSIGSVTQEIAAKNVVSKDKIAQFDVRREKNLDFTINETSLREILGKM